MTQEQLAQLLGLRPDEPKLAERQSLPRDQSARGYVDESLEQLATRLDREGDVVDVLPGHLATIQHLQWALGTYFVAPATERERVRVVQGDSFDLSGGELLVSARQRAAVVFISSPGLPSEAYVLEHGAAERWSIVDQSAPASFQIEVPGIYAFTDGIAGSMEIEAEFRQLRESETGLDRLAAPGLLLRFWLPNDREVRRQQLRVLATEESHLLAAVRRWYLANSAALRRSFLDLTRSEVSELCVLLAAIASTEVDSDWHQLATDLALRRDRLESIRRVLVAGGGVYDLLNSVRQLDNLATTHLTQLADANIADERLRRVLVSEPDAWWGAVSG